MNPKRNIMRIIHEMNGLFEVLFDRSMAFYVKKRILVFLGVSVINKSGFSKIFVVKLCLKFLTFKTLLLAGHRKYLY